METIDKAGKSYWDSCWSSGGILDAINPDENYPINLFHRYFAQAFTGMHTQDASLLEIGCARSQWLPYFAQQFGFQVSGIDYSEIGCQQEELILEKAGVNGTVVCVDMFAPPADMLGRFDVVVSFGVAEHFENTALCIEAFAQFLKPGGMLITNIPNMTGLIGFIQKSVNRSVFDIHVLLRAEDLSRAHSQVGLQVVRCEYFMPVNFGVPNLNGLDPNKATTRAKALLLRNLWRVSRVIWIVDQHVMRVPANRLSGAYVMCIARKQ